MPLASSSGSSPVEEHLDEAATRLGDELVLPDFSALGRPASERPEIDFLGDPVSYPASELESPESSEDDSDAEFTSKGELLERILREHARRDKDGRKFWPYALLARLMVKEQLRSILLAEFESHKVDPMLEGLGLLYDSAGDAPSLHAPLQTREAEAADRRDGYLRVFAILTLLGRLDSLPRFLKAKLNDADLLNLYVDEHLSRYKLRLRSGSGGSNGVSMVFKNWRTVELEMFAQHKESVSPPLLQSTKTGSPPYIILSDESTLPWTAVERETSYGGFGAVHQVALDPLSYFFEGYVETGPKFALKRIQDLRTHERMWKAEIDTLALLSPGSQDHIIPLLAAFKQKDDGFLIFPLADCNLREYWKLGPLDQQDLKQLRWFSTQILGIAQALRFAHRKGVRHGDIKPENILRTPGPETGLGKLVIGDFGIAKTHEVVTELRRDSTDKDLFTANYRPPEFDMEIGLRSRKEDIWSLGCVLLEAACWMLQGPQGLAKFEKRRFSSRSHDGAFWEIGTKGEKEHLKTFRVKEEVRQTMEDLHRHPDCTQYVHELLNLVETRMLVVQSTLSRFENSAETRISSEDLVMQLEVMAAMSTDEYLTRHVPWDHQIVIQSSAQAVEDPKPRETVDEIARGMGNRSTLAVDYNISSSRLTIHGRRNSHPPMNRETPQPSIVVPEPSALTPGRLPPVTNLAGDWSSAKAIEEVLQVLPSTTPEQNQGHRKVELALHWELRRCIRDNLSGKSLGPVLTISGDEEHSWAASCEEYVSHTWGEAGKELLKGLSSALEGESPDHQHDSSLGAVTYKLAPAESEASSPSVVVMIAAPSNLMVMAQFLVWIAATFRLPPESRECVASVASLTATSSSSFSVELKSLWNLDARKPGTCWTTLFPRTVIAYGFPVPRTSELLGLRIPLGIMIDLAGIVQDVTLEGDDGSDKGTYLDGMRYLIYPTRHIPAANEIQWHLVKKTPKNGATVTFTPDIDDQDLPWITNVNPATLGSATAILGYCGKVRITLGTKLRMDQYKQYMSSGTGVERPPAEAVLTSMTVGATIGNGLARGTAAMTVSMVYQNGLMEKVQQYEDGSFTDMLESTAKQPVILFETEPGEERAWMVPKLAVILDIYNFWALRRGGPAGKAIRFADAGFDAGENAKKVLNDKRYVNTVVQDVLHKDDKKMTVGDVIKKIYRGLSKLECRNAEANDTSRAPRVRFGRQQITAWDPLDLVNGEIVSYRRNVISNTGIWPISENPSWLPFTESAPLLVMQGLGQVIIPDHEGQVCRNWDPVPGGYENNYLVAMVNCLEFLLASKNLDLGRSSGSNNTWVLRGHGKKRMGWHVEDEALFKDCNDNCKRNPESCWKQPQRLCEVKDLNTVKNWFKKRSRATPPRSVPSTGAVVFGKKRKEPSPPAPTTASGTKLASQASLLLLSLESLPQILWTLAVFVAAAVFGKVFL